MKIVVIGTRGIPEIQGGVETHCQELYPRIAASGHEVTIIRRTCYVAPGNKMSDYRGVKLIDVYAPKKKSLEAIIHTFLSVLKARRLKPDVVHIHAIGPSLMVPLARLLGLKVVTTNHGPDYDRQKWGALAKLILRTGERLGTRYSNRVIVISKVISNILATKYGRTDCALIFNGVNKPDETDAHDYLDSIGVSRGRYILGLGRFVKEKGFDDLIEAFAGISSQGYKLVLAGDADHPDEYSEALKAKARNAGVILTGFIRGEKLCQVMSGAALYVMSSYHEGLPIALLEAMSYRLPVIVSDIPANRIPAVEESRLYPVGDVAALTKSIEQALSDGPERVEYKLEAYDWEAIARQTADVYRDVLRKT